MEDTLESVAHETEILLMDKTVEVVFVDLPPFCSFCIEQEGRAERMFCLENQPTVTFSVVRDAHVKITVTCSEGQKKWDGFPYDDSYRISFAVGSWMPKAST